MTTTKMNILAIDDEEESLAVLSTAVEYAFPGTGFTTATNGLKGIDLALAVNPDIILLDIVMPAMDGFEVCRRLKEDVRLRHIPVVFLTALKPTKEICEKDFEAGGEAVKLKTMD